MSEPHNPAPEKGPGLSKEALLLMAERAANRAGLSLTRIRRHVYELLLDADEPLGAYDIIDSLDGVGCAKPATAYRALYFLEELGLIRKIKSVSKYVALTSGPSDTPLAFVICRECGTTEQVPLDLDSRAVIASAEARGYQQLDMMIELTGYCGSHQETDFS